MNILLIRLRLIGDVVFTTPVVRALRREFPHARLSYVVEPQARPVVAHNRHLDEVIVAAAPGAGGRLLADLGLARRLRRSRYDVAIDLHGGPRSALLAWLSGAPRRIGYEIPGRAWMYTERVPRSRSLQPRHSVVNQWDLIEPLGFGAPDPEEDPTEMPASPEAAASVTERLRAVGLDTGTHELIVVHVSAGNPFRRWPAEAFAALLVRLAAADERRRVLVVSGPSERDAARAIGARARAALEGGPPTGRSTATAGKSDTDGGPAAAARSSATAGTASVDVGAKLPLGAARSVIVDDVEVSLAELRALLDRAALFIGGDSGPLHVAGTCGVPIVGLYGPTQSLRSAPWRPSRFVTESVELDDLACRPCHQRTCAPGDFRCLAWITPERVAEAAERALRRAAQQARASIAAGVPTRVERE